MELLIFVLLALFQSGNDASAIVVFTLVTIVVILMIIGIFAMYRNGKKEMKETQQKLVEAEANKQKMEIERQEKERQKEVMRKYEEQKYGPLTIGIGVFDDYDSIKVFEQSRYVILNGKPYKFEDILGYELKDNSTVIKGKVISETKRDNASMIGRAIVGDLVAGTAGAIIGGATAKGKTVYTQSDDIITHRYVLNITVNSISEPLISINFFGKEDRANKAASVMNVIVSRNNSSSEK